ncbi:MAG: hypothetical protein CVV27_03615 [Candidatus Melainabacteria bacterium HGW-Melainabacteria-1]|nr:MAG: hypothetical protein CVV27_03615 [Candidatus Melainabacteria bacterium HGW-Melainabacteria-1]
MGSLFARMDAILGAAGALLELQDLIADCYGQATPENVWHEGEDFFELIIDEENARKFLESFDHEDLLKKIRQAKGQAQALLAEAESGIIAYRLETHY